MARASPDPVSPRCEWSATPSLLLPLLQAEEDAATLSLNVPSDLYSIYDPMVLRLLLWLLFLLDHPPLILPSIRFSGFSVSFPGTAIASLQYSRCGTQGWPPDSLFPGMLAPFLDSSVACCAFLYLRVLLYGYLWILLNLTLRDRRYYKLITLRIAI